MCVLFSGVVNVVVVGCVFMLCVVKSCVVQKHTQKEEIDKKKKRYDSVEFIPFSLLFPKSQFFARKLNQSLKTQFKTAVEIKEPLKLRFNVRS